MGTHSLRLRLRPGPILLALVIAGCGSTAAGDPAAPEPRALVVAGAEQRFVSDALEQYALLRERGLTGDQITLALPRNLQATYAGDPRLGGDPVDATEEVDTVLMLAALTAGPVPRHGYVYLAGHGDQTGMSLDRAGTARLDGWALAEVILASAPAGGPTTVVVEACLPDSFLDALGAAPGISVLTAAARGQASYAEAPPHAGNEFSRAFTALVREDPALAGPDLALALTGAVRRSDPQFVGLQGAALGELVPEGR